METSSAFIGGSVALLAVLVEVDRFTPQDLDIYIPEAYAESLARHILSGIKAVGGHSPIYHLNPTIACVEWYSSISHPLIHVHIIMTQSKSPLETLFHSGTSITMNAITGRGIFTAYTDLTPQKISLLQSRLPTAKLYRAVKTRSPLPNDEAQTIVLTWVFQYMLQYLYQRKSNNYAWGKKPSINEVAASDSDASFVARCAATLLHHISCLI